VQGRAGPHGGSGGPAGPGDRCVPGGPADDSLVDGWNSGLVDGRSDTARAADIGCTGLVDGWGGPAGAADAGGVLERRGKGAVGMGVEAGTGRDSSVGSVPPVILSLV